MSVLPGNIQAQKPSANGTVTVAMRKADMATKNQFRQAADTEKAQKITAKLYFDSTTEDGKTVLVRVVIQPELVTKNIRVGGSLESSSKKVFEQYFSNKTRLIRLEQRDGFDMPVEVAAKVNLTGMDTTNLYTRIFKPRHWVDKRGYLHFHTTLAGDIVVSEGALQSKGATVK